MLFMKHFITLVVLLCVGVSALAHHGKGGALMYKYLGASSAANTSKYTITVQHYVNCSREGDEPQSVYLGIFDAGTNALLNTITISQQQPRDYQNDF